MWAVIVRFTLINIYNSTAANALNATNANCSQKRFLSRPPVRPECFDTSSESSRTSCCSVFTWKTASRESKRQLDSEAVRSDERLMHVCVPQAHEMSAKHSAEAMKAEKWQFEYKNLNDKYETLLKEREVPH